MEVVATVVGATVEAMGVAATEEGAEEEDMGEGEAMEDGAEEGDMVEEEETGGTGETVDVALPGNTTTNTR